VTAKIALVAGHTADDTVGASATLFNKDGYVFLRHVAPSAEIHVLEEIFDSVVMRVMGRTTETAGRAGAGAQELVTILSPEGWVPELKETAFYRTARAAMAELFGVDEARLACGGRLFLKPARGGPTPWHQDAAYRPPPHRGGTIWLPLDHANAESGGMEYLPGTHTGPLLPHKHESHHLVTVVSSAAPTVVSDLVPGDATAHHCFTVHRATANSTDRPRRALAIVCQVLDA